MTRLRRLLGLNWHLLLTALAAIALLHICVTLAAPALSTGSAFQRLQTGLPSNAMRVLPPIGPTTQPLPFMTADARYSMCRIETGKGAVIVKAVLVDRGWTMAVYSAEGETLYAATGEAGRATELTLHLVPSDERFAGLPPQSSAPSRDADVPLTVAVREGVLVIRAPDRGLAYAARTEAELARSTCAPEAPVVGQR